MTWETVSVRLRKTSEGKIDSRYPNGNIPGTPLAWAQIPNQSVIEGELLSVNIRSYLSGTNSSSVTITVDGTLPTGWSFSTSTLSYSGTGTGAATIRFIADGTVTSLYLSVEGIAAQPTDTTAPTVPPQITATVSGANITVEWDQAMDPHDGTLPGSQIKDYQLYRNDSLLTTITSIGPGVSTASAMTQGDIGSPTAAGSSSQSVYDWSLTSRGQVDTNTDAFRFVRYSLATPHVVTAKVTGITGYTSDFAKAGVMVRASTAADSAFVSAQVRQNGTLRIEYRAANGGSRITIGTAALASSARMDDTPAPYVWLQLRPDSNQVWTAYYSEDGSTWNILESIPVSFGTDILHGIFACASDPDNAVTATFEDVAVAPSEKGSYTHAPGSASTYKVRARDNVNNASGYSHAVTATPGSPPQTVRLRNWNPGHYIRPGPNRSLAEYQSWLDICVSDGFWKGVQVILEWKHLENSTGTAYNWTLLDGVLNYAISKGKQICVNIWPNNFSASPAKTSPNYINAGGIYGIDYYAKITSQPTIRYWESDTMARFRDLGIAIYDRYRDESNFEFLKIPGESAMGQSSAQSDYNKGAASTNQLNLFRDLLINSVGGKPFVSSGINWWPDEYVFVETLALAKQYGGGVGGPDCSDSDLRNMPTWQEKLTPGIKYAIGYLGGIDYRGQIAFTCNQEASLNLLDPSAEYDIGKRFDSHMSWTTSIQAAQNPEATFANIRAYIPTVIDADPLQYVDYPTSFPTA